MIRVEIDPDSGFCFGVTTAIEKAEEELSHTGQLYCLGDIVHNGQECERLKNMGLSTIDHAQFARLQGVKVLLRAHGEPPGTYEQARQNGIEIIDATCPVVLMLQRRIKQKEEEYGNRPHQIVIFGQKNHAEVLGLVGQVRGTATVIENAADVERLDFATDICLFSQTTKSHDEYLSIVKTIENRMSDGARFYYSDSVCKRVSGRLNDIRDFAAAHDLILFVCGHKSSNGKVLYNECKKVNDSTYIVESADEIDFSLIREGMSIGICGATSTPKWLMEQCRSELLRRTGSSQE